jgi:hypothetical protein
MSPSTMPGAAPTSSGDSQRQGRQTPFEKVRDFFRLGTIVFLAWLWSRKWLYIMVAMPLLVAELALPHWSTLIQAVRSGAGPDQVSAILWDGLTHADDQWWVFALSALMLLVLLPLSAWWVYRHEYPGVSNEALAPYVARRVSQLRVSDYVPKHAYEIDRSHPTTRLVRAALRTAKRSSLSRARVSYIAPLPIGVCIYGRPLHDKTALAWTAMRKILAGWSLVTWPHRFEHLEGIETKCGSRVVLWLDDLHEYANHVEAAQLDMLIDRFAQNGVQVVVVATCRWHEEEREARARMGYLFDHLLPIRLTEQPDDHTADPVVSQPTLDAPIKQSSRTNGGIDLRLQRDLEAKVTDYAALQAGDDASRGAATILRAMGFLRRAGVRVYLRSRVRDVASHLGLPPGDQVWQTCLRVLQQHGYIRPLPDLRQSWVYRFARFFVKWWRRLRGKAQRALADLEPVTIWYLDRVVADASHTPGAPDPTLANVWQSLRNSGDDEALTLLGDAYLNPRNLYLRSSGRQALECNNAALNALGRQNSSGHRIRRAAARLGLGHAHVAIAGTLGKEQRAAELQASLTAFTDAANEAEPLLLCAEALQGQGNTHIALADHAEAERQPDDKVTNHLASAETAFREALARYTRAHSPFQWATTQYDLANTLKRLASRTPAKTPPSTSDKAPMLLAEAEQAYQHAGNVYTHANAPTDWAKIQRDLANAQINWVTALSAASLDEDATKQRNKRLEEAVDALRAAVLVFRQFNLQDDATSANLLLGKALDMEAQTMQDSSSKQAKFAEAYEALAATLPVYRRERRPLDWSATNVNMAVIALRQAKLAKDGFATAPFAVDARVYAERARDCLYGAQKIYRPPYQPPFENPALTSYLNECIREVRDRLKEVETFGVQVSYD